MNKRIFSAGPEQPEDADETTTDEQGNGPGQH